MTERSRESIGVLGWYYRVTGESVRISCWFRSREVNRLLVLLAGMVYDRRIFILDWEFDDKQSS
jgi:hypothetical protein